MRRNAATKADLSSSGGQTSKNQRKRLRDLQGELKPEETQGMSKNLCLPPLDAAKSHPCYTDDDGAQPVPETRACTEAASENATTKPLLDAKRRAAVEDARKGIEQYLSLHDAQKLPPFVTQGMVDMLGSKFKKVPVQGALDELLAADVFKTKEFKKTVVYYPPWKVIEPQEADAKDLGEGAQQDAEKNILASENARLIDELRSVRSSIAKLQKELTFLGKQPALDEVRKAIEEKKRELKRFTDYVTEQGIQTGTPEHAVSIEDMKRAEKTCADSKLRERTYYHLCMNILHRIAADSHSIQELAALIGLDLPTGEID